MAEGLVGVWVDRCGEARPVPDLGSLDATESLLHVLLHATLAFHCFSKAVIQKLRADGGLSLVLSGQARARIRESI